MGVRWGRPVDGECRVGQGGDDNGRDEDETNLMICTMALFVSGSDYSKRTAESTHIPNRLSARSARVRIRCMNEGANEKKVVFWRFIRGVNGAWNRAPSSG